MFRFLFRVMASFCLAAAVIFAVVDATRSIGASGLVMTPLAESWDLVLGGSREAANNWLAENVGSFIVDPVLATLTSWPTFAVFGGLALLFYIIGRRPVRRINRFATR